MNWYVPTNEQLEIINLLHKPLHIRVYSSNKT
jgi:hypothetical protein